MPCPLRGLKIQAPADIFSCEMNRCEDKLKFIGTTNDDGCCTDQLLISTPSFSNPSWKHSALATHELDHHQDQESLAVGAMLQARAEDSL